MDGNTKVKLDQNTKGPQCSFSVVFVECRGLYLSWDTSHPDRYVPWISSASEANTREIYQIRSLPIYLTSFHI